LLKKLFEDKTSLEKLSFIAKRENTNCEIKAREITKTGSVSDIFGDHGNVGLLILEKKNKDLFFLDSFILSCRILGRELESWMLQSILIEIKNLDVKFIEIQYLQTDKNKPSKNFLDNFSQFIKIDSTNHQGKNVNYILPTDHVYLDINDVY